MKKLYVGLLVIILCGTIPAALVAGEIEETTISGDAKELMGLFAGINWVKKSTDKIKNLKNFLTNSDFEFLIWFLVQKIRLLRVPLGRELLHVHPGKKDRGQ